jgi:hypothetical protein
MDLEKYEKLFRRCHGWAAWLILFRQYSWARRLLGGKWELWGHDLGTARAVLSWHPMNDWSDTVMKNCSHVIMKRYYKNGRSLDEITILLNRTTA